MNKIHKSARTLVQLIVVGLVAALCATSPALAMVLVNSPTPVPCMYDQDATVKGAVAPDGQYDPSVYGIAKFYCRYNGSDYSGPSCKATLGASDGTVPTSTCRKIERTYLNGDIYCTGDASHIDSGHTFTQTCTY